jgi:hypothetical protein
MITGEEDEGYELVCDYCEDICDEVFETFTDAVEYKTDRENKWVSIKDKDNEWQELCPSCNCPEIISKLKGYNTKNASHLKELKQLVFEGFEEG